MDSNDTENEQIAQIYQKMMHGDKSALSELQKVQRSPPRKKNSKINDKTPQVNRKQEKQSNFQNQGRKSQNFRTYVKERVAELRHAKQSSKKQLGQSPVPAQQKQYRQAKPFSLQKKPNQQKTAKVASVQIQSKIPKPQYKTEGVAKSKNSNMFQQKMKKNIIKDESVERSSNPPSSKNSFRVRPLNSKKLIEELIRINEQERILQTEILELHNNTKDKIDETLEKYKISGLQKSRMSKISKSEEHSQNNIVSPPSPQKLQNQTNSKLKRLSPGIENQQIIIQKVMSELSAIDSELEKKKTRIAKKQAQIEMSPLLQYINVIPDIFQDERESQEENQEVNELPQKNYQNHDPSRTYHTVMNQRRKKGWGLQKRINYQYETVTNESKVSVVHKKHEDEKGIKFNSLERIPESQNENKIVVNERLKQFLFD